MTDVECVNRFINHVRVQRCDDALRNERSVGACPGDGLIMQSSVVLGFFAPSRQGLEMLRNSSKHMLSKCAASGMREQKQLILRDVEAGGDSWISQFRDLQDFTEVVAAAATFSSALTTHYIKHAFQSSLSQQS